MVTRTVSSSPSASYLSPSPLLKGKSANVDVMLDNFWQCEFHTGSVGLHVPPVQRTDRGKDKISLPSTVLPNQDELYSISYFAFHAVDSG